MPWEAIRFVTSGLTLFAFLAVIVLFIYRRSMKARERLLLKGGAKDQQYVQGVLQFFGVDTARLTSEQAYNLALEQVRAKDRANRRTVSALAVAFIILAALTAYSFIHPNQSSQKSSDASGSLAVLAQSLNGSNSGFAVVRSTRALDDFWYEPVSAQDPWHILLMVCAANPCLLCTPSAAGGVQTMTIGLKSGPEGRTETFKNKSGEVWQHCLA